MPANQKFNVRFSETWKTISGADKDEQPVGKLVKDGRFLYGRGGVVSRFSDLQKNVRMTCPCLVDEPRTSYCTLLGDPAIYEPGTSKVGV